jgi:serine protease Do
MSRTAVLAVLLGSCGLSPHVTALPQAGAAVPTPVRQVAQVLKAAGPERTVAGLPSLAPLVESVKGAVVYVEVRARVQPAAYPQGMDPFGPFFGSGRSNGRFRQAPEVRQGTGSGFIVSPDGRILTNNHVVEGAQRVNVRLEDGRTFEAKVLGRDPLADVALIKIKDKVDNLPTVKLGDSDQMRVGDWVMAIGNPLGLAFSVSAGIISARARDIHEGPYDDFFQTDTAINPGNSGGPLFNLNGEVIGINTAISAGANGIAFAIPSNVAGAELPQLEKGEVKRGWLGVAIQDLTPDLAKALKAPVAKGAVIGEVNDGGPAKRAGLQANDIIIAMDGKAIDSSKALTRAVGFQQPGLSATLTLYRGGAKEDVRVALGERPDLEHVGTRGKTGGGGADAEQGQTQLGLRFRDGDNGGALVTEVDPDSAAERAGLQPGVLIVQLGDHAIRGAADLARVLKAAPHGASLLMRVDIGEGRKLLSALPIP